MGEPWCLLLWAIVRMKQDGMSRAPGTRWMVVTVEPPPPGCPPGCCPLSHGLKACGKETVPVCWLSLATDLQSTQAVKAACLPACQAGRGERQLVPRLTLPTPAPTLLSLSVPVCELINLSPFGKLEHRSGGLVSLTVSALLLGHANTRCGLGALGWGVKGPQDVLGSLPGCPCMVWGASGLSAPSPTRQHP